ncbi:hypothetical protein Tco_0037077, partial [Tanacetum coccineum]
LVSVYLIWQERNNEIFRDETKDWETVCNMVVEIVKLKLMGLRVKKSRAVNGRASDIVDEATYRWLRESCCEDVNCNMVLSRGAAGYPIVNLYEGNVALVGELHNIEAY